MKDNAALSRHSWWAQAVQDWLIALVLAMIVVVPLIASPADSHLGGIAALVFEGFSIMIMGILLWRAEWDLSRDKVVKFLRSSVNIPILLFFGIAVVSCLRSPLPIYSLQETLKLGSGILLYFVVAYQFRRSKQLLLLADTLTFLAIVVSLIGMAQYQLANETRANALFGNSQPLASLLMILLPIVGVIAVTHKEKTRQFFAQIATVMAAGCLLLSLQRSGWAGAVAAFITLAVLVFFSSVPRENDPKKQMRTQNLAMQKHKMVMPLLLVLLSVGFFAVMNSQNSGILERAGSITKLSSDSAVKTRTQASWRGAWEMIQARPLVGWGAGLFPVYQYKFTGEGIPVLGTNIRISLAEQAHNFYLQTAAELGLPALILFIIALITFWVKGAKRSGSMETGIRKSLLMGSVAATVAFAVDAMSSPSWQYGQISMFFWIIFGMGTSCLQFGPKSADCVAECIKA